MEGRSESEKKNEKEKKETPPARRLEEKAQSGQEWQGPRLEEPFVLGFGMNEKRTFGAL
jgi:hypothetical protein